MHQRFLNTVSASGRILTLNTYELSFIHFQEKLKNYENVLMTLRCKCFALNFFEK